MRLFMWYVYSFLKVFDLCGYSSRGFQFCCFIMDLGTFGETLRKKKKSLWGWEPPLVIGPKIVVVNQNGQKREISLPEYIVH